MAASNFGLKLTLHEAGDVEEALREKLARLLETSPPLMEEADREKAGRIETMLRRDFG